MLAADLHVARVARVNLPLAPDLFEQGGALGAGLEVRVEAGGHARRQLAVKILFDERQAVFAPERKA